MPFKKIFSHASDKTLNIFSILTGLLMVTSPFLHFFSVNVLESVFNKTLFLKFSLVAIMIIVVLVVPATFIVSRFLLRTAFYRLFPIFYAGFFFLFLYVPIRPILLGLGVPPFVRPVSYAIFVLLLLWIISLLSKFSKFHLIALVSALSLTAASSLELIQNSMPILFDRSAIYSVDYKKDWGDQIIKKAVNLVDLPNIYFVVPDMYTSVAVLRDQLSFDNKSFIREMEKRGFVHLPDSFSSYANTHLTFASLLQANYPVTEDSSRYESRDDFYPLLLYKAEPFQLAKVARKLGYTISIVGNYWADCGGPHVYCYTNQREWIPYEVASFFEMTPLFRLLRWIKPNEPSHDANGVDAIARTIRYLSSANRLKRPYFMLIHHLSPHSPYLFEADCRVRSNAEFDFNENDVRSIPLYLDNLQCTNKKLIEFADHIAGIDPTALIAIQADHGTWFGMYRAAGIPFKDIPENAIHERMSVVSLVRTPDKCHKWLRSDLNTVNTVRFLFGCATGTEPIYLENKSYMSFIEDNPAFGLVYRVK